MEAPRIRVLLITANRLYREGLARLLSDRDVALVVETAVPDVALVSRAAADAPDVVLIDATLIHESDLARQLVAEIPTIRLIALGVAEDERDLLACAVVGVSGFVSLDASVDDLISAIDGARHGELRCSPRTAALVFGQLQSAVRRPVLPDVHLTYRQEEILRLISEGLSNKQIASRLSIEISTVKNHVHNLLERLHVQHRWQAGERMRPRGAWVGRDHPDEVR
jgi:DNA-binding NarL/FixJ family response regulator